MLNNEIKYPIKMPPFEKMKKQQAEQYFNWFIETIDIRIKNLESYINETGKILELDKTPKSLIVFMGMV